MHTFVYLLFLWQHTAFFTADAIQTQRWNKADLIIRAPQKFVAGEQTEIKVVIKNKISTEWTGYVSLELAEAQSKHNVDGLFANIFPSQYFTVSIADSSLLDFPLSVPHQFQHPVVVSAKLFDGQKCSDSLTIVIPFKP